MAQFILLYNLKQEHISFPCHHTLLVLILRINFLVSVLIKHRSHDTLLTYTFLPSCSDSTQRKSILAEFLGLLRGRVNVYVFSLNEEVQSESFSTLNSLVFKKINSSWEAAFPFQMRWYLGDRAGQA